MKKRYINVTGVQAQENNGEQPRNIFMVEVSCASQPPAIPYHTAAPVINVVVSIIEQNIICYN